MSENISPMIFDKSDGQNLRINTVNTFFKKTFNTKVVKLSLDGGFTCPNRDGSKGYGGCAFCSSQGSGEMATDATNINHAIHTQISLLSKKWPTAKYIAYFQSHSNTYAPIGELREKFEAALNHPDVIGLAIATRPDCISDETISLLDELNKKTFLWIELGLQTMHSNTLHDLNIKYTLEDYEIAIDKLMNKNIKTVTHLILGLPGETTDMMLDSVRYVSSKNIFGLKLHMLNLVKGSTMEKTHSSYVSFSSIDEYVDLLIKALEIIPPHVILHRISADAPRSILIAPEWSYKKRTILNTVSKKMREKNTWQGKSLP